MLSATQAAAAAAPTADFRAAVDVNRLTTAVFLCPTSGTAFNVFNTVLGSNVQFRTGWTVLDVRTNAAVVVAGFDTIYCY